MFRTRHGLVVVRTMAALSVSVNDRTHVPQLIAVLAVMAVMSGLLLGWAKRQGWW
jgi:hypothetical protein